jgi:stage V sporulation protein SpoVS
MITTPDPPHRKDQAMETYPNNRMVLVSASSKPHETGCHIVGIFNDLQRCHVRAMGPNAVNQAAKAIASAIRELGRHGVAAGCTIEFAEIRSNNQNATAMLFKLKPLPAAPAEVA